MIKEAIDRILELGKPATTEVAGADYWTHSGNPVLPPTPLPLHVATLAAVVTYMREKVDGEPDIDFDFVHVLSPGEARVYESLQIPSCVRSCYMTAGLSFTPMVVGQWLPLEEFLIRLRSQCVDTPARAEVLRVLGNVDEQDVRTDADDGVTQCVTVKRGVHLVDGGVRIANPVILAPFRTFPEVEQPESPFILRVRGGEEKQAALFSADGDAWKLKAIAAIAEYLRKELPEVTILA